MRTFRLVHLQAVIFIVIYFLVSTLVVAKSITTSNVYFSFLIAFSFGLVSAFIFLYLFSHEDFFPFFKNLDKYENRAEKGYLGNFIKYGKFLACVVISLIGGQIFLALSIRFLFPKSKNKYWIATISTLVSTVVVIFFGKSILSVFRF